MHFLFRLLAISFLAGSYAGADSGVLNIDWASLERQNEGVSARRAPYPAVLTNGIREVRLPVYLPASHAYDKNMSVVADNNFYTISLFLQGATLIVSGDRLYQQSVQPGSPLEAELKALSEIKFIRSEGMMTTDFNRLGANYSLQLECQQPNQDKRCLQDNYLKTLFNELVVVGGRK